MIQTSVNIIFQFILVSIFITLFFFTYVKNVEETIVKKQISDSITSLKNEPLLINYNFKNLNLQAPDLSSEDTSVENSNKKLETDAFKYLLGICGIGIILVIIAIIIFKLNIKQMILISIPGLVVVGITEFIFLNLFAKNYITLDPNMIKKGIIQGIINYSNS